ncbi:hypothetical protein BDK51DRAFT_52601 [Blyttiomyces helicus]|uniref:Uncharacterized protein n=1 Tax=Blyttiomyces helicus TaxID=388810 RepID=A0A4P9W6A6_9FUNG|nr:hypothetical protein BDK51DRAFT_52601 [Blyttiomyces helicus]|eukprot:RKO86280.1 hypothetical protein BDK51DRAFT_52601 [Blyttiomyces helicus]
MVYITDGYRWVLVDRSKTVSARPGKLVRGRACLKTVLARDVTAFLAKHLAPASLAKRLERADGEPRKICVGEADDLFATDPKIACPLTAVEPAHVIDPPAASTDTSEAPDEEGAGADNRAVTRCPPYRWSRCYPVRASAPHPPLDF